MKNLLVAIDDIDTTTIAAPLIEHALELARALGGRVWLVHVVPHTSSNGVYNVDSTVLRREGAAELGAEHEFLQTLARCMRERGVETKALLIEGATVRTILKESERLAIDLIIMGCHRHRVPYGVLTEFTEEGVLGHCICPIMYVPTA
ncbi:MAG: universal stress protein [Pseudomonadota bacterium]